jgi:hypothetical protein
MYLRSDGTPEKYDKGRPSGHSLWETVTQKVPLLYNEDVLFVVDTEGYSLLTEWFKAPSDEDKPITGVFCDWLQDHRDLLLSGAVGPNPAERLEQVIDWFRQHFER